MSNYLSEAFKKLDILDEDVFELDKDGLTALKDFEDSDEDDMITVVDPDAESEEDLEDSYIGKVILDCSVCHTDIYKDKEYITIDEESGLANIGEECPYCYSSDGFKVIGEVKPFIETEFETEDDVDVEVDGEEVEKNESLRRSKRLRESIEDITIDTGDQEISVSARDKEKKSDGEMITPLSDEVKSDIELNSDDIDVDVDEFSEEDFDELGESYLKKVYENVDGYKTTSAKTRGNKLYVEGLIKFNSGKEKKTSFVFESRTITRTGKAKLIGENLQISRGHKSFKLTGTINNGKFISESLNYNYRVKNGNSSQRVYGTAKKSK